MADISLNLDTTKTNIPNPTVVLRQGDSQYQSIRVTVSDNYTPVDITTAAITFMGTTPAGTKIVDMNVSKASDTGVFDYTFPSQAGSTAGMFANAYFKITDGDKLGSTASFTIQVLDSIDMTQAEASNYVSVVDGVIKTTIDQINSDIQTATSQLDDKVTQANSTIDTKVSQASADVDTKVAGVGAQIDSQVATATTNLNGVVSGAKSDLNTSVQTATDKLNQTIATGNYASQEYVQKTVTSGINAIQKVANAGHADTSDNATKAGIATHLTKSNEVTLPTNFGFYLILKRVGDLVFCATDAGFSSGIPSWARLGANVPVGFRPEKLPYIIFSSDSDWGVIGINTDGSTFNASKPVASGSVRTSGLWTTADDMPS